MTDLPSSAPTPGALRMRRCRTRRQKGMRVVALEIHDSEIEMLVRKGYLAAEHRDDLGAIIRAFYAVFDRIFADPRR